MFFLLLCLLLWGLLALKVPFDTYGWLFLVATGWFCGFLDGKRGRGKRPDSVALPPEVMDSTPVGV
jgi:hypothetical protein